MPGIIPIPSILRSKNLVRAPLRHFGQANLPLLRFLPTPLTPYRTNTLEQRRWTSSAPLQKPRFPTAANGFPNIFYKDSEEGIQDNLRLLNQAIAAVLKRIEISYVDPVSGKTETDRFFLKVERIIRTIDPDAKGYISGGVVRSILGWLYAELYNEYESNPAQMIPETVLLKIISSTTPLSKSDVLGAGSDLDLLIDFSSDLPMDQKKKAQKIAENFINALGKDLPDSALKRSLLTVADINEYEKQTSESVHQGGSPLDFLAFPLTPKSGTELRMPKNYPHVMEDFLNGEIKYIPIHKTRGKQYLRKYDQKGIIRQLRPLLEIPFLQPSTESYKHLLLEFQLLLKTIQEGNEIHPKVFDQLTKAVRNCRFPAASNQIAIPRQDQTDLEKVIREIAIELTKIKKFPIIPELVPRKNIEIRSDDFDPENLRADGLLLSYDDFIKKYTDDGRLYHGTPEIDNIIPIIRCGPIVSTEQSDRPQGGASFGRGFYTTKSLDLANQYKTDSGIILPFRICASRKLRILDVNLLKQSCPNKLIDWQRKSAENKMSFHEYLEKILDIDVIIPSSHPQFDIVLIQNRNALVLPKTPEDLFRVEIQSILENKLLEALRSENIGNLDRITNIYSNVLTTQRWVFASSRFSFTTRESMISSLRDPKMEAKLTAITALHKISPIFNLEYFLLEARNNAILDLVEDYGYKVCIKGENTPPIYNVPLNQLKKVLIDLPIEEITVKGRKIYLFSKTKPTIKIPPHEKIKKYAFWGTLFASYYYAKNDPSPLSKQIYLKALNTALETNNPKAFLLFFKRML